MRRDATYVIIGGTGGIGRSIARRMVQRGACHIVLLSRRGVFSNEVELLVQESRNFGAHIYIKQCDASDEGQVSALLTDMTKTMHPVRGVIHAAMVLKVGTWPIICSMHCRRVLTNSGCTIRKDDFCGL